MELCQKCLFKANLHEICTPTPRTSEGEGFYIPNYVLDFYICTPFYILLELENDLREVAT